MCTEVLPRNELKVRNSGQAGPTKHGVGHFWRRSSLALQRNRQGVEPTPQSPQRRLYRSDRAKEAQTQLLTATGEVSESQLPARLCRRSGFSTPGLDGTDPVPLR